MAEHDTFDPLKKECGKGKEIGDNSKEENQYEIGSADEAAEQIAIAIKAGDMVEAERIMDGLKRRENKTTEPRPYASSRPSTTSTKGVSRGPATSYVRSGRSTK